MGFKNDGLRKRNLNHEAKTKKRSERAVNCSKNGSFVKQYNNYKWDYFTCLRFENLVRLLYEPTSSKSLGVVRALFGAMMVIDIPDERGLADIDVKYGDPMKCHFPLFNWLAPLSLEHMGIVYLIMWIGAAGICLGYKFKLSCAMFAIPYWYIFLLDKTSWNNHSYLFGLLSLLFLFSSANHSFSIDALQNPDIKDKPIPLWNYAVFRFQFFLLYFYAGVKKFDLDWIGGHSMTRLSMHWVFSPFKLVLSNDQIDFWIIHIFGFLFDLTVGFFLLIDKTRPAAILFSSAFHLMNSRLFHIGQFPYVCLVMTPIFCSYDWPDYLLRGLPVNTRKSTKPEEKRKKIHSDAEATRKKKLVTLLLFSYVGTQLFLPYSHFITKGYNNWTNGLYGYSWDMMVHSWDSILVVVKVVDNNSGEEFFIDPEAWVGNLRYSRHSDMLIQYAHCIERNLQNPALQKIRDDQSLPKLNNLSIYIDVWCSLNGRFKQRMFDPKQDLLKANWSPFKKTEWLMPLLSELTPWRSKISKLESEVLKWSNFTDVLFVADFPGLQLENYISQDLTNVSFTVLQGTVVLEQKNEAEDKLTNVTLFEGDSSSIVIEEFHKVYTISSAPSCYMYTYVNRSLELSNKTEDDSFSTLKDDSFIESLQFRIDNLIDSLLILRACFKKLMFDIPIPTRS